MSNHVDVCFWMSVLLFFCSVIWRIINGLNKCFVCMLMYLYLPFYASELCFGTWQFICVFYYYKLYRSMTKREILVKITFLKILYKHAAI